MGEAEEKTGGFEFKVFFSWFSSLGVYVPWHLSRSMASGNQQTANPPLAKERRHGSQSSLGPPRQDLKGLIVNTDLTLLTKKHTRFPNFYLMPRNHGSFDDGGSSLQIPQSPWKNRLENTVRRWDFQRELHDLFTYEHG